MLASCHGSCGSRSGLKFFLWSLRHCLYTAEQELTAKMDTMKKELSSSVCSFICTACDKNHQAESKGNMTVFNFKYSGSFGHI